MVLAISFNLRGSAAIRRGFRLPSATRRFWTQRVSRYAPQNAGGPCGKPKETVSDNDLSKKADGSDGKANVVKKLTDYFVGQQTMFVRMKAAYASANFTELLESTPSPVTWAAASYATPLVVKTLIAVGTLCCEPDYPAFVSLYVSAYVSLANGMWPGWRPAGDQSSLQMAFLPTALCLVGYTLLPVHLGLLTMWYAAFDMSARLTVSDGATAAVSPHAKSLVLAVFGVCSSSLAVALICSTF